MDSMLIVRTAAILLIVTALGGIAMAGIRFAGDKQPPTWLAMLHGLLAASALTLLIYAWFTVGLSGTAALGLVLLVLAALGGVYLNLAFHWKQILLPKGIVIVHTLLAVIGFVLVLLAAFR